MKLESVFRSRGALAGISAMALTASIFIFRANADEWNKKTVLTVDQTIQVRDTVLNPGQYEFRLLDSQSDRHVVQIFNTSNNHVIATILAIPKERMEPTGHSEFTFWETPPGTARAMRAWFYPGDLVGQEFPYPKHLKQIAMAETSTAIPAPPITPTPAPVAAAPPVVEPQPEQQPVAQEPVAQQPVETAQATPPAEPTPAPAPPAELPKTASPYPLIGLSGLVLLGLSGMLKLKRAL